MFREAAAVGGLDIQLVYYRGLAECRASPWVAEAARLGALMARIDCRGGHTQIGKVLAHARRENDSPQGRGAGLYRRRHGGIARRSVRGAGELGLRNVKAFMFQEGYDPVCEQAFREIARLTARRVLPLHARRRARTGRTAARGGGLCRRRHEGARRRSRRGTSRRASGC